VINTLYFEQSVDPLPHSLFAVANMQLVYIAHQIFNCQRSEDLLEKRGSQPPLLSNPQELFRFIYSDATQFLKVATNL
jgi:hypothetical protein